MLRLKSLTLTMLVAVGPAILAAQNPVAAGNAVAQTASSAVQAPTVPALAAAADSTYVIGSTDELMITVWKEPTLSGPALVRPDGMITIPLVGEIAASGKTPVELGDEIVLKLKKIMQNPSVYVVVTGVHSKVVYFVGQVEKKGALQMTPNLTVLEAISNAGGVTEFARTKKIYILRTVNGQKQKIHVFYADAVKGSTQADMRLEPGDTIVVP